MDARHFHARLMEVARDIPAPKTVQSENDLHPDPARLAFELHMLRQRVEALERNSHDNRD